MSFPVLLQAALFLGIVTMLVRPVGAYLAQVFAGENTWLDPPLRPLERGIYRICGVEPEYEMSWQEYAACYVCFGVMGAAFLYVILQVQPLLPWYDPTYLTTPMTLDLAANTAVSFATTTTWQAYGGESTMSYFSQIVGLAAQNFLAGAAGLAAGIAFIRGFARQRAAGLGNFWVDLVRSMLWVLLPASVVGSLLLVWQGVPLNVQPYVDVQTVEGGSQTIAQGPVAALAWIKNLGTNGGGFFNANGAHPYENPTPFTNFIAMLAIVVLPAALTHTFGRMVGRTREGWLLYGVMTFLFGVGLFVAGWAEQSGNPRVIDAANVDSAASDLQPGGNLEGKETRFGIGSSVLTAVVTSNAATGSTNAAHDSFTPLGIAVPLTNMLLGEVVFGGLGTGIYSIVLILLLGLFIVGLMVGRTPEYLGKRIGPDEMKLVMVYALVAPIVLLPLASAAVATEAGTAGLTTSAGPHGFTELIFAYTSSFANNGQMMAGLSSNSSFYNVTTAITMLAGRFGLAVVALALAGSLAQQPRRRLGPGSMPTVSWLFAGVLVGTIVVVGALTYFPALALGPIVEHFLLLAGTSVAR